MNNDHLGFEIPYHKDHVSRCYSRDFIIRLDDGLNLVVETNRGGLRIRISRRLLPSAWWMQPVGTEAMGAGSIRLFTIHPN
ncbi:MAG: hypothetical protein M3120_02925 [Pseudomonadota bacterium]|nr:hypothetical protein [Pseudomonadota bacterium]